MDRVLRFIPIILVPLLAACADPDSGNETGDDNGTATTVTATEALEITFTPGGGPRGAAPLEKAQAAIGTEYVTTDLKRLGEALASGKPLRLALLGRSFTIVPSTRSWRAGAEPWIGEVEPGDEIAGGPATIIFEQGNLFLRLHAGERGYEVVTLTSSGLQASEIDIGALPEEAEPEEEEKEKVIDDRSAAAVDTAVHRIDILLLYDRPLKARLERQTNGLQNFVRERQRLLNLVYTNGRNGLPVQMNVVASELYTGGQSTLASRQSELLRDWPQFGVLRDRYNADLVTLVVNQLDDYCGIAPFSGVRSTTDYDCEFKYTVAHEIGHNLEAGHTRPSGNTNAQICNFGYRRPGVARTLMAYSCDNTCLRQPYFSDIRLKHGNTTMGITCGRSDGAENVHRVRRLIPIASKYRPRS